jgi:hypothetical protein
MKHLISTTAILFLTACASPSTMLEKSSAMAELNRYTSAKLMIELNAINSEQLSKEGLQRLEEQIAQSAQVTCTDPLLDKMETALKIDARIEHEVLDAALKADKINEEYDRCLNKFGATGYMGAQIVGDFMSVGEWLRRVWAAASYAAHISQRAEWESTNNGIIFFGAMSVAAASLGAQYPVNPNQIYITPQIRNGTYVRGHYRTTPNSTCLDNIRGCK